MHDTISIALQVDAKFNARKPMFPRPATILKPHAPVLPQLPAHQLRTPTLPYKKLTLEEVLCKKERGECWLCEEKWVRGHKCLHKLLLMLDVVDEELRTDNEEGVVAPELLHMELSECAFYGTPTKQSV